MKALFKLCNDCARRRRRAGPFHVVDIMACRCIFLPVA